MIEFEPHLDPGETPEIPLPKGWTGLTLQEILHIIALARIVILNAGTRRILVSISRSEMIRETQLFFEWYNEHRPHMSLNGKTPNEVYFNRRAANAKPRIETRSLAKHSTPCARPRMCIAGRAGAKVKVKLEFLEGRRHLPIVKIERI